MINKIKEFSKNFRGRILYELAARPCDKEKIKHVEFLGGNLISQNPYYEFNDAGERKVFVDPEPIIQEFEQHTAMYRGDSEKLCGHYILSLAVGEKLTSQAWLDAVHKYMRDLGYDESTKYLAVIHRDTDKEHVHIVTSRVRLVEHDASSPRAALGANFQLVPDSNDRHKGMDAAREIEHKYDLNTPKTDGWTKEIPRYADPDKEQAHIMRGISKDIFKASNRPRTMSQLVDRFAERGIQLKLSERASGEIRGVVLRLDRPDGRWIPGSTVMDKLSWPGLQANGVNYSPFRDDAKLGKGLGMSQPDVTPSPKFVALHRVYVNIEKPKKDLNKYVRNRSSKYDFFGDKQNYSLGFNVGINFSQRKLTKHEVETEIEKRKQAELIREAMKIVESILKAIFSMFEVSIDYDADVYDLSDTALKVNAPLNHEMLDNSADLDISEQCKKQLKHIASQCFYNERQSMIESISLTT
jgi:hypothetical protein